MMKLEVVFAGSGLIRAFEITVAQALTFAKAYMDYVAGGLERGGYHIECIEEQIWLRLSEIACWRIRGGGASAVRPLVGNGAGGY
jgi:hypothetical protein